jgi:tetratricopeptide (TPR) repeat protein
LIIPQAIALDETCLQAYLVRANVYMAAEKYGEALENYKAANKLDPSNEGMKLHHAIPCPLSHVRFVRNCKIPIKKAGHVKLCILKHARCLGVVFSAGARGEDVG